MIAVGYSMGGPISMLLARRHPDLVSGLVVQATALAWTHTWRDRFLWRVLPIAGSWLRTKGYRRYLNRAVPKVIGAHGRGDVAHPVQPYIPWLVSEMSRNDPFVMVDAGRALADYDARPWAASLGVPAGEPRDDGRPPRVARATSGRWPRPSAPTTRELRADHFATLSHPEAYAALTHRADRGRPSAVVAASSASGVA